MTHADIQSETCALCGGKNYVLSARDGFLFGNLCPCFHCETCGGEGRVFRRTENGVSFLAECDCTALRKRLVLLNEAGIPGKFLDAEIANYSPHDNTQKKAKTRAEDFVKDFSKAGCHPPRGLVFMGGPGVGKTHLTAAILKILILEQGLECKFVDFFQLLSDIRHGYSQDLSEQAIINPYVRSRVLVIDELAKGRNTEWELTVLDQIISSRYNAANKVTILTTNYMHEAVIKKNEKDSGTHKDTSSSTYADLLVRETLQERIGARIYSRLAEMCQFVIMQGPDARQKGMPQIQKTRRNLRR